MNTEELEARVINLERAIVSFTAVIKSGLPGPNEIALDGMTEEFFNAATSLGADFSTVEFIKGGSGNEREAKH